MSKNAEIVQSYFNAVAKGDFDTVSRPEKTLQI